MCTSIKKSMYSFADINNDDDPLLNDNHILFPAQFHGNLLGKILLYDAD